MKTTKIFMPLIIVTMILFTSCGSSTKIISSWGSENQPVQAMQKVLVLGVMPNMENKQVTEELMVRELRAAGVDATAALDVFGPRGFRGLQEPEITNKLEGSDFTSVMIISLINREKESNYYPGYYYSMPYPVGYSRYYRRYLMAYDYMYSPGYYYTSTNYVLQAEIYSITDDELIFMAQTRSFDPGSSKSLAEGIAKEVVAEMRNKRVIR